VPARKFYPAPPCPECSVEGAGSSHVRDTVYSEDGCILRFRACAWCECKWWTKQTPETTIDPSEHRVVPPCDYKDLPRNQKRIYRIESISNSAKMKTSDQRA
jgi:hypothetical protein